MKRTEFEELAHKFLATVEAEARKSGFELPSHWVIDHLCYRVDSETSYQRMRLVFSKLGEELIESIVGGRLITTYKLHQPIVWKVFTIPLIELPAPKKGKVVVEGLEHIEMVCDISFEEIKQRLPRACFDEKGLAKSYNKELELILGSNVAIKFHHQSLEEVILAEKAGHFPT
jgi:predicted metalloenzyme YecM